MYNNVSSAFTTVLGRLSRTFRSRLTVNGDVISDIKSYTLVSGSCGSDVFSLGTVFSSYVNLILPIQDISLAGQEMLLETGIVLDNGTVEYIPMGYFTANPSDIAKSRDQITVKASDRITSKCKTVYVPTVTFPATVGAVISDIASQAGVSVQSFSISGTIETALPTMLCSEALGYIASILGGFVYANRAGGIQIAPFPTASSLDVAKDRIQQLSVKESEYTLGRITVTVKQGGTDADGQEVSPVIYTVGAGEGIDLINPYMTETLFNAMSGRMRGYSFFPGTADFLGDPRLDPIDAISAENYEETEFLIPCMNITQTFDGGLKTTVTAPGLVSSDQSAQGPISQQMNNLEAEMMLAKEVIAKKITADEAEIRYGTIEKAVIGTGSASDFTAARLAFTTAVGQIFTADQVTALVAAFNTATAGTITADNISAARATFENALAGSFTATEIAAAAAEFKEAVVQQLYISKLDADYARINAANITTATIQNAWIDKILVQSGLIAHSGNIYELDAIQVNASNITAGTIDVERLIVSVADQQDPTVFHKYLVHIDTSTGTPTYEKLDGDVIEDLTITADKIVAGAITAEKITTENIVGSGGWINLRNGTFDYENASTGNGISWDGQILSIRANEMHFGTGESVRDAITSASDVAHEASLTAAQNREAIKVQGLSLEAIREEIRLAVTALANNTQIFKGDPLEDYQSIEVPTLSNYPTFTDFFIWSKCANNLYCADSLICGTNNYAAHEDEIVLVMTYNDFYQFRENSGVYSWEQMTSSEIEALSNKYSFVTVDENGVLIKSSRNNQTNQLYVTYDGVYPSLIYCC